MIETERLILRPWEESDAKALFKYASDPEIGPIAGWQPHASVGDSLEIIRTVFAAPEIYAVVLKETGEPIGSCGIMFSDSLHSAAMNKDEAEVGYWLDAVWCGYYDGNIKSKRVCEKSGFTYHHTNKDIMSPLGDKRTEHFYIMTKEDYNALNLNIDKSRQTDR